MHKLKPFVLVSILLLLSWGSANITIVENLSRMFVTESGAVIEDTIEVLNNGESDVAVRFYLSDYYFSAQGGVTYPEPGTLERSNSSWITLGADEITIPSGESMTVPYRIDVAGVGLQGTYWSVIMVEEVASAVGAQSGTALSAVVRYAVQVATTIDPVAPAELDFENPAFGKDESGNSIVSVEIANKGTRVLRARYYLDFFTAQGAPLGRIEGNTRRTYPTTSVAQTFELGKLEPGSYLAIVVADAGEGDVFGAQYNLNVEPE